MNTLSPTAKMLSPEARRPWVLRLFVTNENAASATAIVQLRRIVSDYLPQNSSVEIIDLLQDPEAAREEQIFAIPTLVRKSPMPVRRIVGDLSDVPRVLSCLGIISE